MTRVRPAWRATAPALPGTTALVALVMALAPAPVHAGEPFPALAVAVERAASRPASVKEAIGASRVAEAQGVGARLSALGNPYLEVFADRTAARREPDATWQSNLWLPVEVSGQRAHRIAENDRLKEWRAAELTAAGVDGVATMVARYGRAVVAAERVRFLEAIVGISRQESAMYEARLKGGDVTVREAKLAAVELSRNRMALGTARSALARALAGVARLLDGPAALSAPLHDEGPPAALWELAARDAGALVSENPRLLALAREGAYFGAQATRQTVDSHAPLNVILSAGQGADGSARLGGGLAWTFPLLRRNQGEQARALAERARSLDVAEALRRELLAALQGLLDERVQVRSALDELREHGEPAAEAALEAARSTEQAGKGDLLHVVTARRDLVSVRASGLDLEQREWSLLAELVSISGRSP